MGTIKVVKLVSQETIICQILDEEEVESTFGNIEIDFDSFLFISTPFLIEKKYNRRKREHQLLLQDWLPESDDNIIILPKEQIITIITPTHELELFYLDGEIEDTEKLSTEDRTKIKLKNLLIRHQFSDDEVQ